METHWIYFPVGNSPNLLKVEIVVQILDNWRSDLNTISVLSQN